MINIKAPGRICLFGEHQDYLGYPTLSMAISKYINLQANRISEQVLKIELPDISQNIEIPLVNKQLEYESSRDYLRSGYNIFLRKGVRFRHGYRIRITGDIPINAGCGSSSALVIAWLHFLNLISNLKLKLFEIAQEGYNCEVKEFNEAGGQMDHFTSTLGNVIYLESGRSTPIVSEIKVKLDGFVLGDSLEKKNTVKDLIRVKQIASNSFKALNKIMSNFNYLETPLNKIEQYLPNLKKEYQKKIVGNLINRDITLEAKKLFFENINTLSDQTEVTKQITLFYKKLGDLLNKHQEQLKNSIEVSTNKIDKMIQKSLEIGAFGAKINGSGFGGTMFALFPGKENSLKQAIEEVGGRAYVIKSSNGVEAF